MDARQILAEIERLAWTRPMTEEICDQAGKLAEQIPEGTPEGDEVSGMMTTIVRALDVQNHLASEPSPAA